VKMCRFPVYVLSNRVAYLDLGRTPYEAWGWRNTSDHTFIKCFDWEHVQPWADHTLRLPDFVCFELKWLDADEFAHWSYTDFKTEINSRKRREWELFHALRAGSSLPDKVVRVESPDGLHVIDHLRTIYATLLRRYVPTAPVSGDFIEAGDARLPPVNGRGSQPALLYAHDVAPTGQPMQNEGIPRE
jgi:hypothetical protein